MLSKGTRGICCSCYFSAERTDCPEDDMNARDNRIPPEVDDQIFSDVGGRTLYVSLCGVETGIGSISGSCE